jgi:predicted amidohydrolase YtcJ
MEPPLVISNVSVWRWSLTAEHEGEAIDGSWVAIDRASGLVIGVGDGVTEAPSTTLENRIDGEGCVVLPGLIDAHIHVAATGESGNFVSLANCASLAELKNRLSNHAAIHPLETLPWIQGVQMDQTDLGGVFPTRQDLDDVCPDRPVFIWRACWHVGVANTCALKECSVLQQIPKVEGGSIELDAATGKPTGLLKERAVELITQVITRGRSVEQKQHFISLGLEQCVRFGLTAVQTNDEACYEAYVALRDAHRLPIRIFLTPTFEDYSKHSSPSLPLRASSPAAATMLLAERLKIFSDGSLGADTAAIRGEGEGEGPSSSSSDYRGMLIHAPAQMTDMIRSARAEGFRLEVHAIGDKAAECVLDSFAEAGVTADDRAVLTHCQVLGLDLVTKMKQMGVVANVQPSFVPTDMRWVQDRLSKEKQSCSYIWRTLLESGVVVAGGSDAPIETPNPFVGLYDAMYREGRDAPGRGVAQSVPDPDYQFLPQECLSFSQALWAYTVGAAYAAGADSYLGRIQEGFAADLVLVTKDVVSDPRTLLHSSPRLVLVNGRVIFSQSQADASGPFSSMGGPFIPGKAGCPCCVRVRGGGRFSLRPDADDGDLMLFNPAAKRRLKNKTGHVRDK